MHFTALNAPYVVGMIPQSDRRAPSGMLSPWVSNQMEGPGTRDAPRELAMLIAQHYR